MIIVEIEIRGFENMKSEKTATIVDIASYLGISHTTVSRALSGSPKVKETTRQKVIQAAKLLNYTPNLNARGLTQGRTYTIGLFFTDLKNGTSSLFLTNIITNIRAQLPSNYVLSINSLSDAHAPHFFDGVVIVSQSEKDQTIINQFINSGTPLVVLNRNINIPGVFNYWLDNYQAAYELTTHALSKGLLNIGLIRGSLTYASSTDRSQGFFDAINNWTATTSDQIFMHPPLDGGYSAEGGYKSMLTLLTQEIVPQYVFIENDDMAIGALHAINQNQASHPIAVSGFDDVSFASYTTPSLTTVHSPIEDMVSLGITALKCLISQEKADIPQQSSFKMPIVYRDSLKQ